MLGDYMNYWWLAPVYPQAEIAYRRLKTAIPKSIVISNESALFLKIIKKGKCFGHTIWFKSGEKPDNLYGEDVGAIGIDEASRFRESAYHAARSTLTATNGPMRMIGNIKGKKNWFYRLSRQAESGMEDAIYSSFTSLDAVNSGVLKQEEIDDAKRMLPERVFNELYLNVASEEGSNPFGFDAIRNCLAMMSTRAPVCFGVDLAKSHDWTVIIGIDALGYVCRFERFQKIPWPEQTKKILEIIGKVPTLIDSSGVGDPVVEAIQQKSPGNVEGFKFTAESKQDLMRGLAIAIQGGSIHFPEGTIVDELESFEFAYREHDGKVSGVRLEAAAGFFDDCVCALALAVKIMSKSSLRPFAALSNQGIIGRSAAWMGEI